MKHICLKAVAPDSERNGRNIVLQSGRSCILLRPRLRIARFYHVLYFPVAQGQPASEEEREMLSISLDTARQLASRHLENPEAYVIIHNGSVSRRRKNFHIHIIPVSEKIEKTRIYFLLFLRNIFPWIRCLMRYVQNHAHS